MHLLLLLLYIIAGITSKFLTYNIALKKFTTNGRITTLELRPPPKISNFPPLGHTPHVENHYCKVTLHLTLQQ